MNLEQVLEDIDKAYDNLIERRKEIAQIKVDTFDELSVYQKSGTSKELLIALQDEIIAIDEVERIKSKLTAVDVFAKSKWGDMCNQYRESNELYAEISNRGIAEMGEALKEISMKP